ncbi:MAG: SGNH/GDSL hydrolase family protein [Alphaproteobacteria bacterium]|nr:SGNH/GDSL hydrolase family protein [Alphaproteobacteria bacterium]
MTRASPLLARAALCALALLAGVGASTPALAQNGDICAVPGELTSDDSPLPLASAALQRDNRLRVLVVGTASALGAGASAPEAAYPARLEAELRRRLPRAEVKVAARGGRGLQAEQMLELIDAEVATNPVDLVIWQSGTVDAVSNVDPDQFANALSTGILRLRVRGADTMLMDMQFSRFVRANVDYAPYLRAFRRVATQEDVIVFRRFDLMRHWAESEQIDLERARRSERERIVDQVHGCMARLLADMIQRGLRQ